ncbi:MAG TPA: FAD-dependent oxidoreductase [Terriglobales bacterium]
MQDVKKEEPAAAQGPAVVGTEQVPEFKHLPHVVIVGGGFGGLLTAKALKDAPVRVTLIDRNNHHLFQPLLYWVATAGLSPADISSPIRHVLRRQRNTSVLMAEVSGVDIEKQRVLMGERTLYYDYLVLATGARDNYFGHNEWSKYATGLKSVSEATTIRSHILHAFEQAEMETDDQKTEELLTFVMVGAGPTGVEMAGATAELAHKALAKDFRRINPARARVILVEAGSRILPTFPESLARKAHKALNRLGVEVRTGKPVEEIDANGVTIDGQRVACKTVV